MFDAKGRTHGTGVGTAPTILLENYVTSAKAKKRTITAGLKK